MTEPKHETIAAVVVTYNRKELLVRCLDVLSGQSYPLDAIYIVDNCSTDGTYEYLLERDWIATVPDHDGQIQESRKAIPLPVFEDRQLDVHYVAMPENTGGAGGFSEGLKRAADAGFDWLWLMDDDLQVASDALGALVQKKDALIASHARPFLLNCLVLSEQHNDDDTLAFPVQELSEKRFPKVGVYYYHLSEIKDKSPGGLYPWACPFNGTFLSNAAVGEVGLPNKDFFIWGDERDFLWRAIKVLDIYTVLDSKAFHPTFPGFTFNWKLYYVIRNSLVANQHLNFTLLRNVKVILYGLFLSFRYGRKCLALVLRATKDGLTRNLGQRHDLPQ